MPKLRTTNAFEKALSKVPLDIKKKAIERLGKLKNGETVGLRLHRLKGFVPPVWKIDVLSNKSWQISLRIDGDVYTLLDIGTHRYMDRLGK